MIQSGTMRSFLPFTAHEQNDDHPPNPMPQELTPDFSDSVHPAETVVIVHLEPNPEVLSPPLMSPAQQPVDAAQPNMQPPSPLLGKSDEQLAEDSSESSGRRSNKTKKSEIPGAAGGPSSSRSRSSSGSRSSLDVFGRPRKGSDAATKSPLGSSAGAVQGRSSSANRSSQTPPRAPNEVLIADTTLVKTRLIITKTGTIYHHPSLPFPSAIISFNVVFHTLSTSARVKDAALELLFTSTSESAEEHHHPIIRAISPSGRTPLGRETTVRRDTSLVAGLTLGFNGHGQLSLSRTASIDFSTISTAELEVSGVRTSRLLATLKEDRVARQGIPASFDLAVVLELKEAGGFEIEMGVEATIGRGVEEGIRRMLGSPRSWKMLYDGQTTQGEVVVDFPVAVAAAAAVPQITAGP